jgi:DNA polymerase bacteriophage-type
MNEIVHLDFETFSECELKDAGVYRFSEHPSTALNVAGYAFGDGPVFQWVPFESTPALEAILAEVRKLRPEAEVFCGKHVPIALAAHIEAGKEIRAHNAQFERVVSNGVAGKRLGIPEIKIEQTVCTAAKMSANGMPRSLEMGAAALGTELKDSGGRISMLQLAKPRKPTKQDPSTRWTFENAPEKWIAMLVYNIDDVAAERGIDNAVPDLIKSEQEIYHLDQRINQRGVAVDLEAVKNILYVVEQYKGFLALECQRLTANYLGDGLSPTQREKISDWVRANGWPHLADMQAETVKALCKKEEVPECVKQVLRIYSTYNAKAVSKLQAILDAVCADGRLRGMFLFLGAGTGRWSSLIVQLQNLMRPLIDDPDFALECFASRSSDLVRMMYPDIDLMKVAGSCIRAVLVAAPGKTLLFPDFVGVELRINAWLWGEETELAVYRAQDAGTGPDSYKLTYCEFFGEDINAIDWKSLEGKNKRQIGKVLCLAFGYEGGVSAGLTMVDTYGVDLDKLADALLPIMPEDARQHAEWMWVHHRKEGVTKEQSMALDGAKYMWRKARPKIKQGWKDLKEAAGLACEFPGKTFLAGKIAFRVCEYKGRSWLHMRLPSGRDLKYYSPRWIEPKTIVRPKKLDNGYGGVTWVEEEVVLPGEFRYFGVDSKTHQWTEQTSYGGQLDADADQGFASDLLRNGMRNAERLGFPIIGTVHDELVAEVAKERASVEEIEKGMLDQPAYTTGLPLAVETKLQEFYWK